MATGDVLKLRTATYAFSFDFRVAPADEALLARKCQFLQTDPASPFIQNLVVQRRTADKHLSLRGRVLSGHSCRRASTRGC